MALQDRLEGMEKHALKQEKEQRALEEEAKLGDLRQQITTRQAERDNLSRISSELTQAYTESKGNIASARSSRGKIEALFSEHKSTLKDAGILSVEELLTAEGFSEESDVTAYKEKYAGVRQGSGILRAKKQEARAALGTKGEPSRGGEEESEKPQTSRERISGALQERIQTLDAEIRALHLQTPEGKEAQKKQLQEQIDSKQRPRFDDESSLLVLPEDLQDAEEHGEKATKEALITSYSQQIDTILENARGRDKIPDLTRDLEAVRNNSAEYGRARLASQKVLEQFGEAQQHLEPFMPNVRGEHAHDLARKAVMAHIKKLDFSQANKPGVVLPRPYVAYVEDGTSTPFPPAEEATARQIQDRKEPYNPNIKEWVVENFEATNEQIANIQKQLEALCTMTEAEYKKQENRAGIASTIDAPIFLDLSPAMIKVLQHNASPQSIERQIQQRLEDDATKANKLKEKIPQKVGHDWAEQAYQVFYHNKDHSKLIDAEKQRQSLESEAKKILEAVVRLRLNLAEQLSTYVDIQPEKWGRAVNVGLPDLRKSLEDLDSSFQGSGKELERLNVDLKLTKSNLEKATGLFKAGERKRLQERIERLKQKLAVASSQAGEEKKQYDKVYQKFLRVETALKSFLQEVENRKEIFGSQTIEKLLDKLEREYRPIAEPKHSDPDKAILARYRELSAARPDDAKSRDPRSR